MHVHTYLVDYSKWLLQLIRMTKKRMKHVGEPVLLMKNTVSVVSYVYSVCAVTVTCACIYKMYMYYSYSCTLRLCV